MNSMFYDSPFNQDISNWDVSNVTVMKSMFKKSSFNQSINNWNTSKVTNMQGMFAESEFNKPIGKWDVSKVTEMTIMFKNAINFNQDLTKWCVKYLAVPQDFSTNSPLIESNKPIWGTCPD
jgi:surface protein